MEPRVLSIQTYVVHGYVGNKSATFPLQLLGFEVDAVNTFQVSNHTGYDTQTGSVMNKDQLEELYVGLRDNQLDQYTHMLTGYVCDDNYLVQIASIVRELKEKHPALIYVCDPVIGDYGPGMYVPDKLISIYRDQMLPLADIITPNQFELEKLTGQTVSSAEEALQAMKALHARGPRYIFLSSTQFGDDENNNNLLTLASVVTTDGTYSAYRMRLPRINAHFVGTGDLFSALTLAYMYKYKCDIKRVLESVGSTIQHVLQRTIKYAREAAGEGNMPSTKQLEIRLIQSIDDLRDPALDIAATLLEIREV